MGDWMQYPNRLEEIYNVILGESERGSVLLACHIVDEFLFEMISKYKNSNVSGKVFKDTTGYGGAFGSLSMKSKALFVLGVISDQSFKAIDELRSIRNKAAHSSVSFKLTDHQDRFDNSLNSFGSHVAVKNMALELAMRNFLERMRIEGPELSEKIGDNPFPDEQSCIAYLRGNPELQAVLENQLPKWHMATLTYLLIETIGLNFRTHFDQ